MILLNEIIFCNKNPLEVGCLECQKNHKKEINKAYNRGRQEVLNEIKTYYKKIINKKRKKKK